MSSWRDDQLWSYLNRPDDDEQQSNYFEALFKSRALGKQMVSNCCGAPISEHEASSERCPKCKENCIIELI